MKKIFVLLILIPLIGWAGDSMNTDFPAGRTAGTDRNAEATVCDPESAQGTFSLTAAASQPGQGVPASCPANKRMGGFDRHADLLSPPSPTPATTENIQQTTDPTSAPAATGN